jgi:hypothetical protein
MDIRKELGRRLDPRDCDRRPGKGSKRVRTVHRWMELGLFGRSARWVVFLFGTVSCMAADSVVLVSVKDQALVLLEDGQMRAKYAVSTSRFGLGDHLGSYATPTGWLRVEKKIGDKAPLGAVFKERRRTGEVLPVNAPGRDPIVTRILWLKGEEQQNQNAYRRFIYIHGTPEERLLGQPVSWGCIRMASSDVVDLFSRVQVGTRVEISEKPVKKVMREWENVWRLALSGG